MRKRPSGEKSEENLTMGVSVCHHQNQRSNLGEQFCIPGETSVFFSSCDSVVGDSLEGPHLQGRGKSHGFSRVAAGTWGIFSSYSGDVHSKL